MASSSFLVLILLFAVLGQSHYIAKRFDNSTSTNSICTPEKRAANVRKEWSNLTLTERTEYIDAVLCLQSLPSILDDVPGAITRFDDFAATHINLTLQIHLDGRFLSWHRQFVFLYETALREECGFNGSQPYWNWPMWAGNLSGSPLFDGSATSLSGDGAKVDDPQPYSVGNNETLPHGTGGGCVLSGPFVNHTMNLGPFDFALAFENIFPANWSVYNPHCFTRDLNDEVALLYGNQTAVDNLLASSTIIDFQDNLNGLNLDLGVHGGGHFSIGIGLQDFFASPLDPAFYLHHGGVDRMWTLWQAMDLDNRQYAINGTGSIFNQDTTPEVTVDTVQGWGFLGEEKLTGELMSTEAFDYCYEYL